MLASTNARPLNACFHGLRGAIAPAPHPPLVA
jgi:hypothetical protein